MPSTTYARSMERSLAQRAGCARCSDIDPCTRVKVGIHPSCSGWARFYPATENELYVDVRLAIFRADMPKGPKGAKKAPQPPSPFEVRLANMAKNPGPRKWEKAERNWARSDGTNLSESVRLRFSTRKTRYKFVCHAGLTRARPPTADRRLSLSITYRHLRTQ